MKIINPILSGSVLASGSFVLPSGRANQRPSNPDSGSLFFEISDSGSVLTVYNGSGSDGWETVGKQTTPFAPSTPPDIEYLVVAGGGGGGGTIAGGGGAGGYLSSSLSSMESGSTVTVTVGGGGTGGYGWTVKTPPTNGVDSSIASAAGTSFTTVTATGGGKGGDHEGDDSSSNRPGSGGSGGGGGRYPSYTGQGGSGTVGQGSDGGDQPNSTVADNSGAGGGGAGAAGDDNSSSYDTDGGVGKQSKITGTLTYYAGGGGAGTRGSVTTNFGEGGSGGGGNGNSGNVASSGTTNTGGGGGGGGYASAVSSKTGGDGGSGVVILAYDSGSANGAGGIVGDAGNGRKYHQFNASNTFKVGSTSDFQIHSTNLVLHYDAGNYSSRGTSTFTDLSDSGFNGTVSGPTLGQDFYYDFDGSNDLISFSSNGLHTSLKAFEIWFNADSWNGGAYFPFQIGDGQGVEHFLYLDGGGTNYTTVRIGNAQAREAYSATSTWIHVAATINDSNYVELYRNASLVATSTSNPSTMSNDTCYLGARNNGGTVNHFNGKIAQLRIYSENLTAAQITQNYNATKTNFV